MARAEVSLFIGLTAATLPHYNLDLSLNYAGSVERSPKVNICYFHTTFVARYLNNGKCT